MFSLILGNLLSLCAVVCLAISVVKKNKKSLIAWQVSDTAFFVASTLVLRSYSAVVTNSVSLLRNLCAYYGKLNKALAIFFCGIIVVIGLYLNNRGVIGWLPMIASIQYTICMYVTKNEQQMRYALAFNLILWIIHDFYIQSYPSAINSIFLCVWSLVQAYRFRKRFK